MRKLEKCSFRHKTDGGLDEKQTEETETWGLSLNYSAEPQTERREERFIIC